MSNGFSYQLTFIAAKIFPAYLFAILALAVEREISQWKPASTFSVLNLPSLTCLWNLEIVTSLVGLVSHRAFYYSKRANRVDSVSNVCGHGKTGITYHIQYLLPFLF